MELKKIDANKLIFSGLPMDDRTNTYLSLEDYDWMTYVLQTQFKTEKMGILRVKFEFLGVTSSTMTVEQTYKGIVQEYQYEFLSDIFQKYIVRYLKKQINCWETEEVFNGEDEVVEFYNEVIEKGKLVLD